MLDVENSHIDDNSAWLDGGAVYVAFSSTPGATDNVVIINSTLSDNVAGPTNFSGKAVRYLSVLVPLTLTATTGDDHRHDN